MERKIRLANALLIVKDKAAFLSHQLQLVRPDKNNAAALEQYCNDLNSSGFENGFWIMGVVT